MFDRTEDVDEAALLDDLRRAVSDDATVNEHVDFATARRTREVTMGGTIREPLSVHGAEDIIAGGPYSTSRLSSDTPDGNVCPGRQNSPPSFGTDFTEMQGECPGVVRKSSISVMTKRGAFRTT